MHTQHATAALLLGRATLEVLPAAIPIQPYVTENGFGYDFIYKGSFHPDLFPEIERFMLRLRNLKEPIHPKTMMRENAVVFLEHHGKPIQAEIAGAKRDNLLQLVGFDLIEGELLGNFGDIGEFKLYDVTQKRIEYSPLGEISWLRIEGVVFPDKQAMKNYTKNDALVKKSDPVARCRELELIDLQDRPFWLPQGMLVRDFFMDLWKKGLQECGIERVLTPLERDAKRGLRPWQEEGVEYEFYEDCDGSLQPRLQDYKGSRRTAQWMEKEWAMGEREQMGLFRTSSATGDQFRIECREGDLVEVLNCLLQFIQNIATLLSFEPHITLLKPSSPFLKVLQDKKFEEKRSQESLAGSRLEVAYKDLRGQKWLTSVIQVDEKKGSELVLKGSFFFSLERVVALLAQARAKIPTVH